MAAKTYWWISAWFLVTVPVIAWDVGYCFMRPRSMKGGDLHWIWRPYALYQEVDYVYGVHALENNDGFTNAQSFMNVVETLLNIVYVYLAHGAQWPGASTIGFGAALMTLSKTILYWLNDYYCGWCNIGHNDALTLLVYWILPNGLWIVVPSLIVWVLGKDIAESLTIASTASKAKGSRAKKNN
ncbi:hypothetical protein P691DRAFT_664456 [Macrolepiota fuliginosa MF-IS2]|uniref:EXPERA domain-containing protein n=1 Tax=Macrolepiota fuliginosa MF-IS2 TaxID=1400762 RepID=A0A9P5XG88_9AGAR|nr:hypothetical protein P691DRAFT_664456 [Macrolepiota fuliginosa MF-IS2]